LVLADLNNIQLGKIQFGRIHRDSDGAGFDIARSRDCEMRFNDLARVVLPMAMGNRPQWIGGTLGCG